MLNKVCWGTLWVVSCVIAYCVGSANAQFVPPPPVISASGSDGFTHQDRELLLQMSSRLRAIHARLFPLEEERRILEMR